MKCFLRRHLNCWASLSGLWFFAASGFAQSGAFYGGGLGNGNAGGLNGSYYTPPARVQVAPGWNSAGMPYVSIPTATVRRQIQARTFFAGGIPGLAPRNQPLQPVVARVTNPNSRIPAIAARQSTTPASSRAPLIAGNRPTSPQR